MQVRKRGGSGYFDAEGSSVKERIVSGQGLNEVNQTMIPNLTALKVTYPPADGAFRIAGHSAAGRGTPGSVLGPPPHVA